MKSRQTGSMLRRDYDTNSEASTESDGEDNDDGAMETDDLSDDEKLAMHYSDVDIWGTHFQRLAEGKVQPNHKGHYIVEHKQVGQGQVSFVTPIA